VRGEEPCPDRPITNAKGCGNLPQALALCPQFQNSFAVYSAVLSAPWVEGEKVIGAIPEI
jgi:hypothetical protein